MLAALKQSPEAGNLVRAATKYLTGVKGTLVQKKKQDEERRRAAEQQAQGLYQPVFGHPDPVELAASAIAPPPQNGYPAPGGGEYRFHFDGNQQR